MKIAQVRAHDDPETRLAIAKEIISAKVRKPIPSWVKNLRQLKTFEGNDAQLYFANFANEVSKASKGKFEFKSRMPPESKYNFNATSEVNALLNFGYTVLEAIVRKHVLSAGLLPEIGFVHEVAPGKEPLVYDLEEPFRCLIDDSVLGALPHLSSRDFTYDRKSYRLRLKPKTCNLLLQRISQTFEEKREYLGASWRTESIVLEYVRSLASCLLVERVPEFPSFNLQRSHLSRQTSPNISPVSTKQYG